MSLTGLAPTISALTAVPARERTLFPVDLDDPMPVVVETFMDQVYKRAVVGPRYKLVVDVRNGGRMLFDLKDDPSESRNVYGSVPSAASEMERLYQTWLDGVGRAD